MPMYKVQQVRKFNGEVTKTSFDYECEQAEMQAIVDKLEGVITVFESNVTLSSPAEATNVVTGGLPIESISMVHSEAKTQYLSGYRPVLFKSTTTVVELQNLFKTHKPFSGSFETENPDNVYPRVSHMGAL